MKIDPRWRAIGCKWKRNDLGSLMKINFGLILWALNGREMTLGHK